MPELDFKGKEFVRNHHLTVPYRPLEPVPDKGIGEPDLTGNLIIHGDNLEALKALLPMYAGKVDCIFIDPPYNTGNEGWAYNDKVNSPVIKAWFSENPVGVDDALRHDKWCCMMWPRLKLLRELLSETGSLWMTIDQNEVARAWLLLVEIFGDDNKVAIISNVSNPKGRSDKGYVATANEYILTVRKSADFKMGGFAAGIHITRRYNRIEEGRRFRLLDLRKTGDNDRREDRQDLFYSFYYHLPSGTLTVEAPDTLSGDWIAITPKLESGEDGCWRWQPSTSIKNIQRLAAEVMPRRGVWTVYEKDFLEDDESVKPTTNWAFADVNSERGTEQLEALGFSERDFNRPKPLGTIQRILSLATKEDSIILDSFAGSGTTAHAVLELNRTDGGTRKFILAEMESYSDTLTAERVRRVINGYPYQGTQRETLLEKRLTWTQVKRGDALRQEALDAKALHEADYDSIETQVEDGVLKVIGVRNVEEQTPGLGGSFTYCELGRPIELEKLLSGGALPDRNAVAEYILYLAGLDKNKLEHRKMPDDVKDYYLGTADGMHIWLLYRPDKKYLSSADSALTLETARAIHTSDKKGRHRVYSPAKYVGTKRLRDEKIEIEHVPLPLALFRGHTE